MPSREQCQSSDNLNYLFYLSQTLLPQKTGPISEKICVYTGVK